MMLSCAAVLMRTSIPSGSTSDMAATLTIANSTYFFLQVSASVFFQAPLT
jgi:hypothetical protein